MNKAEFRQRFEEYWCWASNSDRSESAWWASVEEFAEKEFNRAYKAQEVYDQEVPRYGDLMSVYEFASAVANGSFIDYDGFAHPVKDVNGVLRASRTNVNPSDIEKTLPSDATHVVWFNK